MIRADQLAGVAERTRRLAALLEMMVEAGNSTFLADALPIAFEYALATHERVARMIGPRAA